MNKMIKLKDKDYFKSEGLSNSFLIRFDRSPKHAMTEIESTKPMQLGTMLHEYILQPEEFYKNYLVLPYDIKKDARLKPFKEFQLKHPDKILISEKDLLELEAIKNNILTYELFDGVNIKHILENSQKEIAFFWDEEFNGETVQRKAKIDIYYESTFINMAFDLKKTEDCRDFHYAVKRYQYYRQAATYIDAVKNVTGQDVIIPFITVEMSEPFGVIVHKLSDEYIDLGRKLNRKSIINYIEWEKSGSKPELYTNGIQEIDIPDYLRVKDE